MRKATDVAMTCAHCGEQFRGNPRSQPLGSANYCSIACEEGRTPLPMSNPQSPDYHLFLKGEPETLVGKMIVADGLKLVDYSPEWCKNPNDWTMIVDVDRINETYVREDHTIVGTVVDYDGHYTVEHEDIESGEVTTRRIKDMLVVDMIRQDRWWVE